MYSKYVCILHHMHTDTYHALSLFCNYLPCIHNIHATWQVIFPLASYVHVTKLDKSVMCDEQFNTYSDNVYNNNLNF